MVLKFLCWVQWVLLNSSQVYREYLVMLVDNGCSSCKARECVLVDRGVLGL
jgi:hypothetical protein